MKSIITILAVLSVPAFLFSQGIWNKYTEFEGQLFGNIRSLEFDKSGNLYFSDSNRLIKKDDENNFKDLSEVTYSDSEYYNTRGFELVGDSLIWGASELGFLNYNLNTEQLSFIDRKDIIGDWNYGFITGLCADSNGKIWFASRTPYISVFNGEEFYDYDVTFNENILKLHFTRCTLVPDHDSNIWVLGDDGILKVSTDSSPENFIYTKFISEDIQFEGRIKEIIADFQGNIWASSNKGELAYFKDSKWNIYKIPDEFIAGDINDEKNYIQNFGVDNQKNLLLFWKSAKFFLTIDPMLNITKTIFPEDIINTEASVFSFICSPNGTYWFGTMQKGLLRYQLETSVENSDMTINNQFLDIYILKLFPNPAKDKFTLDFTAERGGNAQIYITDVLGNNVAVLYDYLISAGSNSFTFSLPKGVSSGSYYVTLEMNGVKHTEVLKIMK